MAKVRLAKAVLGLVAAACCATIAGFAAPDAHAILGLGNPCNSPMSQPFAAWGDNASYTQVPGGTFESGSPAWSLTGGASVVSGNQPFGAGSRSLSLPAGSSATSPFMCVGTLSPTLRLFGFSSSSKSPLAVSIYAKGLFGILTLVNVGIVYPGQTSWAPTNAGLFLQSLGALLTNTTQIAFRFTPLNGSWTVDDIWVDPFLCK